MSPSKTVTYDDKIELPAGVAAAYTRSLRILANSTCFVDRVPALADLATNVINWRWAGAIDAEQFGFLLRNLRREVDKLGLGEIEDRDIRSASDVEQVEEESREVLASLGVPTSH